ncbi:MAG: DPP IV N-terminal domain-containing protein [Planctomycetota bacterium]
MNYKFANLLVLFLIFIGLPTMSSGQDQDQGQSEILQPLTVAESSDFTSTSSSAEVEAFVDQCDKLAEHVTRFDWGETVEGRKMVGAIVSRDPYQLGDQDERNVVLLLGNIHSGECAGKEALLELLRKLSYNPNHSWLDKNVILFAPNYNADANDRVGKNNRPGQVGPVNGMGQRQNAQQLDLNRDFGKIESPEARALVKLIDTSNPHLFVDCHTTNGSVHQYCLTYDIPHNPATAEPIRNYLRNKMMPKVTADLDKLGQLTFYYGNFNSSKTAWTTYGHEPRYSTEYVGLRGRLAILSEAYAYLDYKGRIVATRDFVSSLLDFATENSQEIHQLLDAVDSDLITAAKSEPARVSVSLSAAVKPFPEKFTLKGFKEDQPCDFECDFVGDYISTYQVPLPFAYVLTANQSRVADRLLMHGATIETIDQDVEIEVSIDTIKTISRNERAFQKHKMVRVDAERSTAKMPLEAGSYVIHTSQPLGRLIAYLLESESDDGFAFWNFFDADLEVGKIYPVFRIENPIELETTEIGQVTPSQKISLDLIDGPDNLLSNLPRAPSWFGNTNWIKTEFYNREVLVDAATGGFVDRPARPYNSADVEKAAVERDIPVEIAKNLAASNPKVATNGSVALFSSNDYTIAYYLEKSNQDSPNQDSPRVEILGNPEAPAELLDFNHDESKVGFTTPEGLNFFEFKTRTLQNVKAANAKNLLGKLDWVYQEELYGRGNFKGFWWQSGGDQVAFLNLDESPLYPFTVMDHMPVRGKSEFTNYPKAGDPNPIVSLGVVDSSDCSQMTWVDLSNYRDEEILISRVSWSADGQQLLAQVQNREQTWLDLVAADADGKNVRVLFRDQTPAWIESPGDPVLIDNGEFLWRSPRSGYSHIYRYDKNGKLLANVTEGDWEVRSLIGVSPDRTKCFFTATRENPLETHCYAADLKTGNITPLTTFPGSHSVRFSHDFSYFIDSYSNLDRPTKYFLRDEDGKLVRRIHVVSDDRLQYLDIQTPEFIEVAPDSVQPMDAMLIKPTDFDPNKKYPVLVHVYGGPQAPRVRNRFGGQWYLWHQMLAQKGYLVWVFDNRSCSYRSVQQAWPIHRNMAENELADIEKGVDWLKSQPWVDKDRIGLWGWSYGGYMTAYALTRSRSFKMGISGAPVTDWKNYDSIYTERYMGTPQNNPEGYKATSVLYNNAKNLHGKLLLIHGTIDDNVHLNNTIQFAKELQYAGKQFELMLYPSNRHSVRDKKQAAHLRKLMTQFVLENL